MAKMIRLEADNSPMDAMIAVPSAKGRYPGIVLLYHQAGFSPFTRDYIDRLAASGYVVIAPDNFHHSDPKLDLKERKSFLRDAQIANDIAASVDWLKNNPMVDRVNLAILGHCQGGRMAFLGASVWPKVFRAAVIYYCGNMFSTRGDEAPTPFERLRDIQCPVIGFFGNDDHSPSAEEVDRIEAELKRCAIQHQFFRYEGAGHGFCDFGNPKRFHENATRDSWDRTLTFLNEHLSAPQLASTADKTERVA